MTSMKKAISTAGVLAGLVVTAAPASADPVAAACRFLAANQNEFGAPNRYAGAASGHVFDGGTVSVQCLVRVDGVVRGITSVSSGTGLAVVAGAVNYERTPTEKVSLCVAFTTSQGSDERCVDAFTTPVVRDARALSYATVSVVL